MKKIIVYHNYQIEIFYDLKASGYLIHYNGRMVDACLGFSGFNYRANGLLDHAQESINTFIARERLRKLGNTHKEFINI